MSRHVDFLIVGGGLAGTFLSHFLLKKNKKVLLIDEYNNSSSSRVAGGIIHPVTGRRIVKSWMADTFIPFAEKTYLELEEQLGKKLFYQKTIIELVKETKEYNDWVARSESSDLAEYISLQPTMPYKEQLQNFPFAIGIKKAGYLDLRAMIETMGTFFFSNGILLQEKFISDELKQDNNSILYKDIHAEKIIFCEGYLGMTNTYWKHLPWQPSKGELLIIRCEGLKAKEIINRKIFILPIGDSLFKVGSTYAWDSLNEIPTDEALEKLKHELENILRLPYKVVDHVAGVRPTVKERRPFLGLHSDHPSIGIFNGLGTKGVMTGPWLAHHYAEHLSDNIPLLDEVNVRRFH